MYNSVIIASNAFFLVDTLREILNDASFNVSFAKNENELTNRINEYNPRHIFLEHCFNGLGTDVFIQNINKHYRNIKIAVWTASEVKPITAARFIFAGADSFFSLRDTYQNIKKILSQIAGGHHYYPANVETLLDNDNFIQTIGVELTKREIQIIKLLSSGMNVDEISGFLSLSIGTILFHKNNIFQKFGVNKTIDIFRIALIQGIINKDELEL